VVVGYIDATLEPPIIDHQLYNRINYRIVCSLSEGIIECYPDSLTSLLIKCMRCYKRRKLNEQIYTLQLCCKTKGVCLPELVARQIYLNL